MSLLRAISALRRPGTLGCGSLSLLRRPGTLGRRFTSPPKPKKSPPEYFNERIRRLREVYKRFDGLDKDSPEYDELADSGKCWYEFHDPQNLDKFGYKELQQKYAGVLKWIDKLCLELKMPLPLIAKTLVKEYAHQSVMIEDNHLQLRDSEVAVNELDDKLFRKIQFSELSASDLPSVVLPSLSDVLPHGGPVEVTELRNHIICSHWVAETAPNHPLTSGFTEREIQALSATMLRGLGGGGYFGTKIGLGDYRQVPIQSRSNPFRIYPYPREVPVLMKDYVKWRDNTHQTGLLHPLILACHSLIYFLWIHPFQDGNGRIARTIMHDYLVRQSFTPVVFQDLHREDYLRMISDAQDGDPRELVERVLETQLVMLQTFVSGAH